MDKQSHKDHYIGLRLTEEEKGIFVRRMSSEGYNSRSRYLRDCIFKHETSVFVGNIDENREIIAAIKENTAATNKFGSLINQGVKKLYQINTIRTPDGCEVPLLFDGTDTVLNMMSDALAIVRQNQAKLVDEIVKRFPVEKR